MNNPVVVVDADAIIGQVDSKDPHHAKSLEISQRLSDIGAQVLYPITAIAEATAYMQRVLNDSTTAFGTAVAFTNPDIQVIEVDQDTLVKAMDYFSPTTSKKNTLFDCIVAATAKEHKADAVFSFDKFYKKRGFKLAYEL